MVTSQFVPGWCNKSRMRWTRPVRQLLDRSALAQETMGVDRRYVFAGERRMELKRKPGVCNRTSCGRSSCKPSPFWAGRSIRVKPVSRFEITCIAGATGTGIRRITGRNRATGHGTPNAMNGSVSPRKRCHRDKPGLTPATLLHPVVALLGSIDVLLEQQGHALRQGAVLVDPADDGDVPPAVVADPSGTIRRGSDPLKRLHFDAGDAGRSGDFCRMGASRSATA